MQQTASRFLLVCIGKVFFLKAALTGLLLNNPPLSYCRLMAITLPIFAVLSYFRFLTHIPCHHF